MDFLDTKTLVFSEDEASDSDSVADWRTTVLPFGKYKNTTLCQMIQHPKKKRYLRWILNWDDL